LRGRPAHPVRERLAFFLPKEGDMGKRVILIFILTIFLISIFWSYGLSGGELRLLGISPLFLLTMGQAA